MWSTSVLMYEAYPEVGAQCVHTLPMHTYMDLIVLHNAGKAEDQQSSIDFFI